VIRTKPKNLFAWKAAILSSNLRYWDSYNKFELLSSVDPIIDIRSVAKNLDSALNVLFSIFARGGRAWFYNVFYRRKRYLFNLRTMLYRQSPKPFFLNYGLIFPIWYPGRLNNRKFIKIRLHIMKKKLFFHKFSALRRSFRFYKAGGFRSYVSRRRRRYRKPHWAKLDRYWRPRSRSRRRGFSYKRLALHFKNFMKKRRKKKKFRRQYRYFRRYRFNPDRITFKTRRAKKNPKSWVFFDKKLVSFFYKPDLGRALNLYLKFIPFKYQKIQLNKIEPGTPEKPTNLPLNNMPTRSLRRQEKKKKKIFKSQYRTFNNVQGDDFRHIINEQRDSLTSKSKRYLAFDKALFFPTARFYKLLVIRPYKIMKKLLAQRYLSSYDRRHFNYRYKRRDLQRKLRRRIKPKSYRRRFKLQSKVYDWLNKVMLLSNKILRLRCFNSFSFRGAISSFSLTYYSPFTNKSFFIYKKNLIKFKVDRYSLLTLNRASKRYKEFYNFEFRRFVRRLKYVRRFKLSRIKPKLGKIVADEKVYKNLNNKASAKVKKLNFKRKTLINVFLNSVQKLKLKAKLSFNFSIIKPFRQQRLVSGKYFNFRKFYKYKRSPTDTVSKSYVSVIPNVSNRKFTNYDSYKKLKVKLHKSKRFTPVQTTKLPHFLRDKFFKKKMHADKYFNKFKDKIKLNSKPYYFYPTIFFVTRLSRLTSTILNECRVVGVISVYFSSGEASPLSTIYTVLMNDRRSSLARLELVIKNLFFLSKTNTLLGKSHVFIPYSTKSIH